MASGSELDSGMPSSTPLDTIGRVKVEIKRPTTIHDDGDPTNNFFFDAKRVLRLIEDERYLSAEALYHSIRDRIQNEIDDDGNDASKSSSTTQMSSSTRRKRTSFKRQKDAKKVVGERQAMALQLLEENEAIVKKMEDRCIMFKRAKKNLDINDDWTLAQTLFGVTSYYRHESDGSMSIKMVGPISDCSLFDQLAVIREFDLNHLWAPFVTSSKTVALLDKVDIVGWFQIGLPHFGLMRDALFRAIGCDSMYEDGSFLIVAHGIADIPQNGEDSGKIKRHTTNVGASFSSERSEFRSMNFENKEYNEILDGFREDPILDTLDLPPIPTRVGGGRVTIRSVAAQIHVESPTSGITTIVANIDLNVHILPQALIGFVMKRICGALLYKMKSAALKIGKEPIINPHAIKIREEKDFYKTFLLPKVEGICKLRGWQMPSISALELSDAQLEMADEFIAKQKQKSETKAPKLFTFNNTDSNLDEYLQASTSCSISHGEVVGNSGRATKDDPKVRSVHSDLDDMSDISKFSTTSSFWSSNPISNYRRQIEERKQLSKDREIQEARERAAARLKPKSLNEDAVLRLKELRGARNRHKSRKEIQVLKEDGRGATSEVDKNLRRWNVSLSSHGFFTKIFVLQFLMVSLFCLLYLDTAFNKVVAVRVGIFGMERGRDMATLIYIGVAGLVHCVFCYIALFYAFTSLQLGSIAGKRTKRFYGDYVHYVVVITSASMVSLGIIKPGIDKFLRWIVWNAYSSFKVAKISLLAKIPDKVVTTLDITVNVIITVISTIQKTFLESSFLGRCIISVTKAPVTIVKFISYPFATYAETAIKQYEGYFDALPWREDAFFTTRALLSHSAFFLLVLLLLFNFAAKQARNATYADDDNAEISSSDRSKNSEPVESNVD